MNEPAPVPVVVGVDDTDSARRAVRLAAAEAVLRGRPLRVVHAHIWPVLRVAPGPPRDGPRDGGLRRRADRVLEAALAEAARSAPGLAVSGEVVDGSAPAVLLRESRTAALLVVGHRGLRALSGVLIGSVAVQVSAQAHSPVLVTLGSLGDPKRASGPVLVGVDGTQLSERAIDFAFEEAAMRGTELVALHAVNGAAGPDAPAPVGSPALASAQAVDEWLAAGRERFPQVSVTRQVVRRRPARVLIAESAHAQLVVTGALGRGGLTGLVRGSVSQAVLRDSQCPLAIVRREMSVG